MPTFHSSGKGTGTRQAPLCRDGASASSRGLHKFYFLVQVGQETLLKPPSHGKNSQKQTVLRFAFDASYSSMDDAKPMATQSMLFDHIGRFALDNALKGDRSTSQLQSVSCCCCFCFLL
jgi:hypothetical protein